MNEIATLTVKELPDGTIVLTWDKNDPKCDFLNNRSEEEIITIFEKGLESMIQQEKQARLKALEELTQLDQELGLQ